MELIKKADQLINPISNMTRNVGLDLARTVAAYLVVFGHYVLGSTFAVDDNIQMLVGYNQKLPLFSKQEWSLWSVDIYLLENFNTAAAVIGVALFFVISGYIVPQMLYRYSLKGFIVNRFFRIYPMLVCAVIIDALIKYRFGRGVSVGVSDFLSTITLLNQFSGFDLTLGVVWSLFVEIKFYIILYIVGVLNFQKFMY